MSTTVKQTTDPERAAAPTLLRNDLGNPHLALRLRRGRARDPGSLGRRTAHLDRAGQDHEEFHEPSLYRVLRALAALGVFQELEHRRFSLTFVGERLCTGAPPG